MALELYVLECALIMWNWEDAGDVLSDLLLVLDLVSSSRAPNITSIVTVFITIFTCIIGTGKRCILQSLWFVRIYI